MNIYQNKNNHVITVLRRGTQSTSTGCNIAHFLSTTFMQLLDLHNRITKVKFADTSVVLKITIIS